MNVKGIKLSESLKNVMKISGGTIVGQMISIITLPVITRIYGAEIMGVWATILSVALILQAVSDWGMTNSLMLEDDDEKVVSSYTVITTITLITSLVAMVVIYPFFSFIKKYTAFNSMIYTMLTIVYAFTVKQVNTSYTLLNRYKRYSVLMKNPIINYSSVAVISIIFWKIGFKTYGYYFAVIVGQIFTLINMRRVLPLTFLNLDLKKHVELIKKYKDFLIYQTPNNLMLQLRDQLPNILIGSLFGDKMLGYYSVSVKILNMPVTFIGQAIGKVFYQKISESNRNGEKIDAFVRRNFTRAIKFAALPVIGLFAAGDIAAVLFFGVDYYMAGQMLRIVVFKTVLTFISTCMQGLEIVLRKQQYALVTTFAQMSFSSLAVVIGFYLTHNIFVALVIMTGFYIMVQLIYYSRLFDLMKLSARVIIRDISGLFIITILIGSVVRYLLVNVIQLLNIDFLRNFFA